MKHSDATNSREASYTIDTFVSSVRSLQMKSSALNPEKGQTEVRKKTSTSRLNSKLSSSFLLFADD